MTKTEASRGRAAGSDQPFARDPDTSPGAIRQCLANDVTALLNSLAGQMEQSERRQTAAILDVKSRLEALQQLTASARDQLPTVAAKTLDRTEASIAVLSEQVAAAGRNRIEMRSILEAEAAAAITQAPQTAEPKNLPVDPENPWSADDAETLAAIYHPLSSVEPAPTFAAPVAPAADNDETQVLSLATVEALALADPDAEPTVDHVPPSATVPADLNATVPADQSATVLEGVGAADRGWLEPRLEAMAADLRSALEAAHPERMLRAMGDRIGTLEHQLAQSMGSLATRSDLEALGAIDDQLAELSQQFVQTNQQMTRLDVLEHQVRAIASRLSDERFEKLTQAARPADGELNTMASKIAELVGSTIAHRLPKQPTASNVEQTRELHSMLTTLMAEHRQSDEQTAHVLDTMQQALIGLLDRMDALEGATAPAFAAPDALPQQQADAELDPANYLPADLAEPEPEPEPARLAVVRPAAARTEPAPAPVAPVAPVAVAASMVSPEPARPAKPMIAAPIEAAHPTAADAVANPVEPDDSRSIDRQPPQENRDEFIAAARRAMRQSRIQQINAEETAAAEAQAATAQTRAGVLVGETAKRPGIDRRILVAMLAVVVLGAGYQLAIKPMLAQQPAAAQLAPEVPAAAVKRVEAPAPRPQGTAEPKARTTEALTIEPLTPAPSIPKAPEPQPKRPTAMVPAETKSEAPVVQGPRPSLRPVPETLVDELSHRPATPEPPADTHRDARAPQAPGTAIPLGIFVQHTGSIPNPQDLQRIQDRQTLAQLSGQLGAAQRRPVVGMQPMQIGSLAQPSPVQIRAEPVAVAPPAAHTEGQVIDGAPRPIAVGPRAGIVDALPASVGPTSLRLAAQGGDPSAEFEVATRLAEGRGVQQDHVRAAQWYQRAADRGFGIAQYRLASMYERGVGVVADRQRALALYQQASTAGHVKAMHNLGVLVASGGTQADYIEAAKWFQKAGQHGLSDSQFNLAVLFEGGLGVERDLNQAYRWLSLAARQGDAQAMKRVEKVKKLLAQEDVVAVDLEITSWRPLPTDRTVNDPRSAGEGWKTRQATRPTQ